MIPVRTALVFALSLAAGSCGTARAGAPQPDQRQGDFVHVCSGGAAQGQTCTVQTQDADCPGGSCVIVNAGRFVSGTLTIIAHDAVADWSTGGATNRALTLMLEVRGPDGRPAMIASTYQNLADPTEPPTAPGNVVAIAMDEAAVKSLAPAVSGLLFAQPDAPVVQHLQQLFGNQGVPAIVAVSDRRVQSADHTADGLATVLRFKVKLRFLTPAA